MPSRLEVQSSRFKQRSALVPFCLSVMVHKFDDVLNCCLWAGINPAPTKDTVNIKNNVRGRALAFQWMGLVASVASVNGGLKPAATLLPSYLIFHFQAE